MIIHISIYILALKHLYKNNIKEIIKMAIYANIDGASKLLGGGAVAL